MGKLLVTGDIHGEVMERFSYKSHPELRGLPEGSVIVVLGDFGVPWNKYTAKQDKYILDWLAEKPWTTLIIPGNHDNYDMIAEFPTKQWCGGEVNAAKHNILYAKRGEIFNILGNKVLTISGAQSHDINGGIIDSNDKDWRQQYKEASKHGLVRIKGISWWPQEVMTQQECDNILEKIKGQTFDFVFSHDCPTSQINGYKTPHMFFKGSFQNDCLEKIYQEIEGTPAWLFGHYHKDESLMNSQFMCLYKNILMLDESNN